MKLNKNNIGAFYLHPREWVHVLPYPNPILACDKEDVFPTFREVGSYKNHLMKLGVEVHLLISWHGYVR